MRKRRASSHRSSSRRRECRGCGAPIVEGAKYCAVEHTSGRLPFCLVCESRGEDPRLWHGGNFQPWKG